jgi:WD40-like Beta Propeller Repeat
MRSVFHPWAAGPGSAAAPPAVADPEVVIRQARARQRRRRRTATVMAAALAAGGALYLAVSGPSGPKPGQQRPARTSGAVPSVNAAAFAGHGELAFVSRGALWVLDGATRTLRITAAPDMRPSNPVFSADGRWLAFVAIRPNPSVPAAMASTVWLAHGDGSGVHQIGPRLGLIGWSPAADVLAVTAGNSIRLISPSGAARTLVRAAGIGSAAWAPGGSALAVATGSAAASTLASYPVAGGRPTTWLHLRARSGMNYLIDPAGWWPRQGIGFWALTTSPSLNADQDPFYVIPAPGAHPRLLGNTLTGSGLDQVAGAPRRRLAIVAEVPGTGIGRLIWQGRRIEVCQPAAACAAIPSPPHTVTLDPAWSPDGATLAFVQAPTRASPGFPQPAVARWYNAHQLWVYHPAAHLLRRLDARGATVPAWSADGNSLLYAARDGIWLLPQITGRPVRIATPLFQPGNWPTYYGQVSWAAQFAWWSGHP